MGNSAGVLGSLTSSPLGIETNLATTLRRSCCFDLALIYNGINSSIDAWRGKHDSWGSMAAGGITGALFKSTGKLSVSTASILSCAIST